MFFQRKKATHTYSIISSCSFKGKKLDILIQIMAFSYIKTTLKLNYSLQKKFLMQNMAFDIFVGISGKTVNKIQVISHTS